MTALSLADFAREQRITEAREALVRTHKAGEKAAASIYQQRMLDEINARSPEAWEAIRLRVAKQGRCV